MKPSVLILPGYQGSGETHWQTIGKKANPDFRVEQRDWEEPIASEWAEQLEQTLQKCEKPVVLVAHSIACLVLAHWASKAHTPIKGALIVAPPNPEEAVFPKSALGFTQTPMMRFNFPSIVLASSDDPYATMAYVDASAMMGKQTDRSWKARSHQYSPKQSRRMWEEGYAYLQSLLHM